MRILGLLLSAALLLSCGGGDAPMATSPSPAPPAPPRTTYQVSGTVRDDNGVPVQSAAIFLGWITKWPSPRMSTTTDANGVFQGSIPEGNDYRLQVSKPGHVEISRSVSISADTVLDLTLPIGIRILGKVMETGVGPLGDAVVEVVSGPSAGVRTLTGPGVPGSYLLDRVRPGEFLVRASKPGYDSVERVVRASTDTYDIDFSLKWAYGTCLQSVAPVSFDPYPSAGGTQSVTVTATAGRTWTATPDSPWIEVMSSTTQTGSGQVTFRVLPNPVGATVPRRGALMIRCSAFEGQNVWVNQNPQCNVRLESAPDSPAVFEPSGGLGHLVLHVGTPGCRWQFTSQTDWIRTVGISSWSGDLSSGVHFVVSANSTGIERTGTVVVGETAWQVRQR